MAPRAHAWKGATSGRRTPPDPSKERGATVFEFALILPLFITLVFGIIEFGHAFYLQHAITTASREGARHVVRFRNIPGTNNRWHPKDWSGAAGSGNESVEVFVRELLKNFFTDDYVEKVTVGLTGPAMALPVDKLENSEMTVTVQAPKRWIILGPLVGIPDTSITAATTMRLE